MSLLISDEMAAEIDLIAKFEHATRGEVIRDAIRAELKNRAEVKAVTPLPLRAVG